MMQSVCRLKLKNRVEVAKIDLEHTIMMRTIKNCVIIEKNVRVRWIIIIIIKLQSQ